MSIPTLILIFICIFSVTIFFIFYLKRIKLYKAVENMPGPLSLPGIGCAYLFIGSSSADFMNKTLSLLEYYPSPARFTFGSRIIIALSDPEQMKAIFLSSNAIEKDDLFKFIRPWLGTGLFSAPASKWKVHRKIILPTFNKKILESFVDVFVTKSKIMVKQMEIEMHGNEFDVFNYVSLCTLEIVYETAMGISCNVQSERYSLYVKAAKKALELIVLRIFKLWLHPDSIFNLTMHGKELKECITYLHKQTDEVILKKKEILIVNLNKNNIDTTSTKKVFLDLLMELNKDGTKLTNEELREEVDTMMIAGNDTTATVNSFVFFMLANFPKIQDKCYEELREIYGDKINDIENVPTTCEDLNRMEYLDKVIKETMRLFPVGPILLRQLTGEINIDNYVLPKGCSIFLAIIKLHRDGKIWENPLKFDPDRFSPEEIAKRHPYSYVPFSAGPRNCIGMRYAMMAMKVMLSTVLRTYILKRNQLIKIEDIKFKSDIIIKPVKPLTILIERR